MNFTPEQAEAITVAQISKEAVLLRIKSGMTVEQAIALGNIANVRALTEVKIAARTAKVSISVICYRVRVLGWTLNEATDWGKAPSPPPPEAKVIPVVRCYLRSVEDLRKKSPKKCQGSITIFGREPWPTEYPSREELMVRALMELLTKIKTEKYYEDYR